MAKGTRHKNTLRSRELNYPDLQKGIRKGIRKEKVRIMPKFQIKEVVKTAYIYELEADTEEEAFERFQELVGLIDYEEQLFDVEDEDEGVFVKKIEK